MAIITGVHFRTTSTSPKAGVIIARMEALLERRRHQECSRQQFLDKWRKLRKVLLLTDDYQQLRKRVSARAGGVCEVCHEWEGKHVHHLEPVAYSPRLVLMDSNCIWSCEGCHPGEDKKSQLRVRRICRRAQGEGHN